MKKASNMNLYNKVFGSLSLGWCQFVCYFRPQVYFLTKITVNIVQYPSSNVISWAVRSLQKTAPRAVKCHCHLCMLSENKKVHILLIANSLQNDGRIWYHLKLSALCTTGVDITWTELICHFHDSWHPNQYRNETLPQLHQK